MKRALWPLVLLLTPLVAQAAGDTLVQLKYQDLGRSYLVHLPNPMPTNPPPRRSEPLTPRAEPARGDQRRHHRT